MGVPEPGVAERLYYDAQKMLTFAAEVVDIRLESRRDGVNRWQVALDRTAFYPESGGQPWDMGRLEAVAKSGARLEVPVLAVVEDGGEVWHVVEKPLSAGTSVVGYVDEARRLDHMQQHTGQHLLSAVFLKELGAATVSFHLGAESSTIDLALTELSREDVVRVEEAVNALVAKDRRVTVMTVERRVAEGMLVRGDLGKLPEREGAIRVVEIEGVEWNACGGTHVGSTGQIGSLGVRRVERVRQGIRVEFCCGLRMVRAARRDLELVAEMSRVLSTGSGEMVGKVARMLEEARVSAKARCALLEELAEMEAREFIDGRLMETAARDVEYGNLLATTFTGLRDDGVALIWAGGTVTLAAGRAGIEAGIDCGAVMKAALVVMGARGGGSPRMAQGQVEIERVVELCGLIRGELGPMGGSSRVVGIRLPSGSKLSL